MNSEIKEMLDKLEVNHDEMNTLDVEGDFDIIETNNRLRDMGIKFSTWVGHYAMPSLHRVQANDWQIGYSIVDGEWCLACMQDYRRSMRLTDAPPDVRIMGVKFLPEIIKALLNKVAHHMDSVDYANSALNKK